LLRNCTTVAEPTYPYVYNIGGFDLECFHSFADCIQFQRRHPLIVQKRYIVGLHLLGIYPGMTAKHVVMLLSRNQSNHVQMVQSVSQVYILPPIPHASPPLPWRAILLTKKEANWFDIALFKRFNREHRISVGASLKSRRVFGFETRNQLVDVYEPYYHSQDVLLPNEPSQDDNPPPAEPSSIIEPSTPAPAGPTAPTPPKGRSIKVSNFTSKKLTTKQTKAALPTSQTSMAMATRVHKPVASDSSMIMHKGNVVDIIDLVNQLVRNSRSSEVSQITGAITEIYNHYVANVQS